ncbi:MAG: hypothetical protein ABEK59_13495 [Halobacteria archaeon]
MPSMKIDYRYPDRKTVLDTMLKGVRERFKNVEVEKRAGGQLLVDINDYRVVDTDNGVYWEGVKNVVLDIF